MYFHVVSAWFAFRAQIGLVNNATQATEFCVELDTAGLDVYEFDRHHVDWFTVKQLLLH